jgi:hypothetical protein
LRFPICQAPCRVCFKHIPAKDEHAYIDGKNGQAEHQPIAGLEELLGLSVKVALNLAQYLAASPVGRRGEIRSVAEPPLRFVLSPGLDSIYPKLPGGQDSASSTRACLLAWRPFGLPAGW